jgi:hypothetical protein
VDLGLLCLDAGVKMTSTDADKPAPTQALDSLKWAEPAEDIKPQVSLSTILTCLQLLATDEARNKAAGTVEWDEPTPGSVQVIRSGALSITKWWTNASARVGGITGLAAVVAGFINSFFKEIATPVTTALIGGGALVLSATAIALALFVRGDLEARARATAARHTARAEVTSAFLRATAALPQSGTDTPPPAMPLEILLALAAFPEAVKVATKGHPEPQVVTGLRHDVDEGLQLELAKRDWIPVKKVEHWSSNR